MITGIVMNNARQDAGYPKLEILNARLNATTWSVDGIQMTAPRSSAQKHQDVLNPCLEMESATATALFVSVHMTLMDMSETVQTSATRPVRCQ